ncbi:hypothetical protein D3C71_1582930 [compost metagenome]
MPEYSAVKLLRGVTLSVNGLEVAVMPDPLRSVAWRTMSAYAPSVTVVCPMMLPVPGETLRPSGSAAEPGASFHDVELPQKPVFLVGTML